ncbi:J domain-containing protein DDB_G0295729-like [Aphidius gifuensis]|uniref:J domain-containing protein DDB_G0295729-like n=1 Tax=Aphidius gifuensis TaxID=684658 RepID=UPI001CDC18D1|nr:J domain-containing protein DDB_G0295729-like [Aphidius gifuensis]
MSSKNTEINQPVKRYNLRQRGDLYYGPDRKKLSGAEARSIKKRNSLKSSVLRKNQFKSGVNESFNLINLNTPLNPGNPNFETRLYQEESEKLRFELEEERKNKEISEIKQKIEVERIEAEKSDLERKNKDLNDFWSQKLEADRLAKEKFEKSQEIKVFGENVKTSSSWQSFSSLTKSFFSSRQSQEVKNQIDKEILEKRPSPLENVTKTHEPELTKVIINTSIKVHINSPAINIHHHNDSIITNDDDNYNDSYSNYIARNTTLPDSNSSDSKSEASIEQEQEISIENLEEQCWEDELTQQVLQAQNLIAKIDLENTKKKEKELRTSPVATNNLNKGNKNNDNKNTGNLNIEPEQRIPINNKMADATAKRLAEIQETTHLMTLMNKLCKSISTYTGKSQELTRFRIECEESRDYVGKDLEKNLVEMIVRTKVSREVRDDMTQKKFESIEDLMKSLRELISKTKNEKVLIGEAFKLIQRNNEPIRNFVKRIRECTNFIEEMHTPAENERPKQIKNEMKELAKNVLRSGIKPELGDYINWSEDYE